MFELSTEALLDLRANLSPEAENEPSTTEQLVIVGLMRQVDGVAWKGDRHIGHQVQSADRSGQGQRREHIVCTFEGGNATCTGIAQLTRPVGRIGQAV
jgi:hypothetical protein